MSNREIKSLSFWKVNSGRTLWIPCGLNLKDKLWWRFMPGVVINVAWPNGEIVVTEDHPLWDWTIGPSMYKVQSADPNEHYRPFLEKHVGRQGWDWNWGMADRDATDNRLTIKIRQKYKMYATIAALQWS